MSVDVSNAEITSGGEPEHYCPPESAWVRCDDCYKWRRIPVSVADLIDENCRWYIFFSFVISYFSSYVVIANFFFFCVCLFYSTIWQVGWDKLF